MSSFHFTGLAGRLVQVETTRSAEISVGLEGVLVAFSDALTGVAFADCDAISSDFGELRLRLDGSGDSRRDIAALG